MADEPRGTCMWTWGDWGCALSSDHDGGHEKTWINGEDDIDPRLT